MVNIGKWLLYGLVGAFALSALIDPQRALATTSAFTGVGGALTSLGGGIQGLFTGIGTGTAKLFNPLFTLRDLIYGPQAGVQVQTDIRSSSSTQNLTARQEAPSWVSASAAHESGMVAVWAGANGNIPAGWLLCDGSSIATATYPDLHTAIGYVYGGAGANFNLPDLVNTFVRGQSSQTAATGGADSLTLSTAQMPTHTHVVTDPGHNHSLPRYAAAGGTYIPTGSNGSPDYPAGYANVSTETTGISNANTGSSNSFDNRPAYIEMQYIIKT